MSFKDLFEVLPQLLDLFVPGFIFLITFKFFSESPKADFNITVIGSIVLSYIFKLFSTLICQIFDSSELVRTIIAIIISFCFAILIVKLRLTKIYNRVIVRIGRTTGNKSIWYDFFDVIKGARIRFFAKFNNQDAIIEGDVNNFEVQSDGSCSFIISNFQIKYCNNNNVYDSNCKDATMIFNTNDIHGLEAHYGK